MKLEQLIYRKKELEQFLNSLKVGKNEFEEKLKSSPDGLHPIYIAPYSEAIFIELDDIIHAIEKREKKLQEEFDLLDKQLEWLENILNSDDIGSIAYGAKITEPVTTHKSNKSRPIINFPYTIHVTNDEEEKEE